MARCISPPGVETFELNPLVIFDITVIIKGCFAIEFIEQILWIFAKRVDKKIQSPTVGHADHNLFRPM